MRIEETSNETIVHCGSEVDLSSVVDQKEILLHALQIKKPISLEASEISKIDTAGIQLLRKRSRNYTLFDSCVFETLLSSKVPR